MIRHSWFRACRTRRFWVSLSAVFAAGGFSAASSAGSIDLSKAFARAKVALSSPGHPMPTVSTTLLPVAFSDLPGWESDDHLAAWKAFVASCAPVLKAASSPGKGRTPPEALVAVCGIAAAAEQSGKQTRAGAKAFFESHFRPHSVEHEKPEGLLTGYYEPLVAGSRTPGGAYQTPVYKRPADLVNMVAESERGAKSANFTHMRKTKAGLQPYMTRAEIEQGGLKGKNLELLYLRDPVDMFFMQIQGSGRVELPDGHKIRISYDGKNGYPYTSIGRMLIDDATFKPEKMSLQALKTWLRADRKRAEKVMWQNQSYVFFRELEGPEADGPVGALGIGLHAGRSLAVDTAFHSLGTPIYVSSPSLKHAGKKGVAQEHGFARLMVAHDVGSAIKGPERGDIYFGSGAKAGRVAGVTKNAGRFFVLLPEEPPARDLMIARQR